LEITAATIEVRQINPREAHREAKQEINLFSNTPRSWSIGRHDVQTGTKFSKHRSWKTFGEDVGKL